MKKVIRSIQNLIIVVLVNIIIAIPVGAKEYIKSAVVRHTLHIDLENLYGKNIVNINFEHIHKALIQKIESNPNKSNEDEFWLKMIPLENIPSRRYSLYYETDIIIDTDLYLAIEKAVLQAYKSIKTQDRYKIYNTALIQTTDSKVSAVLKLLIADIEEKKQKAKAAKEKTELITGLSKHSGYKVLKIITYNLNGISLDLSIVEKEEKSGKSGKIDFYLDAYNFFKKHYLIKNRSDLEQFRSGFGDEAYRYTKVWALLDEYMNQKEAFEKFEYDEALKKEAELFSHTCQESVKNYHSIRDIESSELKAKVLRNLDYNRYLRVKYKILQLHYPYEPCSKEAYEKHSQFDTNFFSDECKRESFEGSYRLVQSSDSASEQYFCPKKTKYHQILQNPSSVSMCKAGLFHHNSPCNVLRNRSLNETAKKDPDSLYIALNDALSAMQRYGRLCIKEDGTVYFPYYSACKNFNDQGTPYYTYTQVEGYPFKKYRRVSPEAKAILEEALKYAKEEGKFRMLIKIYIIKEDMQEAYNFWQMYYSRIKKQIELGNFDNETLLVQGTPNITPQYIEKSYTQGVNYSDLKEYLVDALILYRNAIETKDIKIARRVYNDITTLKSKSKNKVFNQTLNAYTGAVLFKFKYLTEKYYNKELENFDYQIEKRIENLPYKAHCNDALASLLINSEESKNKKLIRLIYSKVNLELNDRINYPKSCYNAKDRVITDIDYLFEDF
jgi:hypothetical protein